MLLLKELPIHFSKLTVSGVLGEGGGVFTYDGCLII